MAGINAAWVGTQPGEHSKKNNDRQKNDARNSFLMPGWGEQGHQNDEK